ncbi:MAG: DUF5615 family PIN-like protein [Thermomicrobiales bacterium]
MKLLLDEMWTHVIAEQLRRRGHDVVAVVERGDLAGKPDDAIFMAAQREHRVFVTDNEDDFCPIVAAELSRGHTHVGIILTTNRRYSRHNPAIVGRMVTALITLLEEDEDFSNRQHWLV